MSDDYERTPAPASSVTSAAPSGAAGGVLSGTYPNPGLADADLAAIAALDSSTSGAIASDGSGWIKKTYAQFKTALGLVKADVGLGSVDNTADTAKPVSTATQTALDLKQDADADLTAIAALTPSNDDIAQRKAGAWTNRTPAQLKTDLSLAKADVGLGSVDNTADSTKPVSTATQTALDAKQALDADLTTIAALDSTTAGALTTDGSGWIRKTYAQLKTALSLAKADVGLGNVDNTADTAKPISTATQTALDVHTDSLAKLTQHSLTSGEAVIPRELATGNGVVTTTQVLRLTYFTAKSTETITSVATYTGGTAAGATPTLVKIGIYSVAGNGDLTLEASTANTTSLFTGSSGTETVTALSSNFSKVKGTRYATGILVVTSATAPTTVGVAYPSAPMLGRAPKMGAAFTAQTDLPGSVTNAQAAQSANAQQVLLIP